MPQSLSLDCLDSELAARTTPQDWRRIAAFRNHPRILDGVLCYGRLLTDYFADNAILNRVVTEQARFQTIACTLHLFDSFDPERPGTGLTFSNLQKICLTYNLASPGGVTAFLGLMQFAGYMKRVRSDKDRRVVNYVVTEKFITIVEGWNSVVFQALDAIWPEDSLAASHRAHPRFGWDMRERGVQILLAGWKPLDPFPEVMHFVASHGGLMLLLHCVAETIRLGERQNLVPISVDLARFGARFGVSRSHLRRMLETAHEKGLLQAPPRNGGHILLSPDLAASYVAWFASELGYYRQCARATKAELGIVFETTAGCREQMAS